MCTGPLANAAVSTPWCPNDRWALGSCSLPATRRSSASPPAVDMPCSTSDAPSLSTTMIPSTVVASQPDSAYMLLMSDSVSVVAGPIGIRLRCSLSITRTCIIAWRCDASVRRGVDVSTRSAARSQPTARCSRGRRDCAYDSSIAIASYL
eukprot:1715736-Prymnesium_polylepis.1